MQKKKKKKRKPRFLGPNHSANAENEVEMHSVLKAKKFYLNMNMQERRYPKIWNPKMLVSETYIIAKHAQKQSTNQEHA